MHLSETKMNHSTVPSPANPQSSTSVNQSKVQVLKSSPWTSDDLRQYCTSCHKSFDNFFNRRHHCRLCGDIFCNSCSDQRALIPPSSIVLQPKGGKKVSSFERSGRYGGRMDGYYGNTNEVSFQSDDDPDRTVTFAKTVVDSNNNDTSNNRASSGAYGGKSTPADSTARVENDDNNNFADTTGIFNADGISLSTIQIQKNLDDNIDMINRHNTNVDNDENIISQSMAALMPPSSSNAEDLNEQGKCDYDDDDLSVSVATSTAFSYVSNGVSSEQHQHKQQEPIDQKQQYSDQEQQYKDEEEKEPLSPLQNTLRHVSSSSDTSSTIEGYMPQTSTILYGKGLEERMKLAREPLRVCVPCHDQLQAIQEELRIHNSNAMKYNSIDPTNIRRLLNSPLAFTLGHEIRKAAYTLNNLLPMPRRMGLFLDAGGGTIGGGEMGCDAKDTCKGFVGNFGNIDGVKIPAKLIERCKGVAVMTCIKSGVGVAGIEFGTGLVVSRLSSDNYWSPPCAIGTAGLSWGALVGLQLSDHVFLLMTDKAVDMFVNNEKGSFQLGADIGVAVGPLGRSLEADVGASDGDLTPIYTYSLSKGFYAGISLDGKVIVTRHHVNEKFYGRKIDPKTLLSGEVPTPPAAQPLYDALKRCHVYASSSSRGLATWRHPGHLSVNNYYGDGSMSISSYDNEDDYNMSSRHF